MRQMNSPISECVAMLSEGKGSNALMFAPAGQFCLLHQVSGDLNRRNSCLAPRGLESPIRAAPNEPIALLHCSVAVDVATPLKTESPGSAGPLNDFRYNLNTSSCPLDVVVWYRISLISHIRHIA